MTKATAAPPAHPTPAKHQHPSQSINTQPRMNQKRPRPNIATRHAKHSSSSRTIFICQRTRNPAKP